MTPHSYAIGEEFSYIFENTDFNYQEEEDSRGRRLRILYSIEELQAHVKVSIVRSPQGHPTRKMEITDAYYKKANTQDYGITPYLPLTKLVPGFPDPFTYLYATDSSAVAELAAIFASFMNSSIGSFLYYKVLDVHTFQSIIESMPASHQMGQLTIMATQEIPLPKGKFVNNKPTLLFHRIEEIDGRECAVLKYSTVGNRYITDRVDLTTDYVATIYVPLEGPEAGVLLRGELQETVIGRSRHKPVYIVRRLSLRRLPKK